MLQIINYINIYKLKINIDYSDIDRQKAEISPKMLFKKRKLEAFEIKDLNQEEKNNNLNNNLNQTTSFNNPKINSKMKNCFEKYLDFVHSSYFNSFENMILPATNTAPNPTQNQTFEEELTQDVIEIITVYSAKLYGSRSNKNKEFLNKLKEVVVN
jgi:hypothetical protein